MPTVEDGIEIYPYRPPAHQADAVLSQVNPVSNTLYTVLDTTRNVRIIEIYGFIAWAVTQPTLELIFTVDGRTIICSHATPINSTYYLFSDWGAAAEDATLNTAQRYRAFILEGRSVKIEARTIWAVTQPTSLQARVKWARWTP